jgi:hypothetical protein
MQVPRLAECNLCRGAQTRKEQRTGQEGHNVTLETEGWNAVSLGQVHVFCFNNARSTTYKADDSARYAAVPYGDVNNFGFRKLAKEMFTNLDTHTLT